MRDTLQEVSVTAMKGSNLRFQPTAVTRMGIREIERLNVEGLRGASEVAPNFYMPRYGSAMTSSIYVRGIGARMDQAAVGLNVDNVPFLTKDAYDIDLADIESIEVMRGPQSTLYGRNAMAGMINITTLSPLRYQGARFMMETGVRGLYRGSASVYHKFSPRVGVSMSARYRHYQGGMKNVNSGENADRERDAGIRQRTVARIGDNVVLDNVASVSFYKQDGYPYAYEKTGEINYNDTCYYRRLSVTDGLTVKYSGEKVSVGSVTSFQYLDDDMTLDQDFLPRDYFTITQRRWERGLTQDFVIRGDQGDYKWLAGIFGFYKHSTMSAPVVFKDAGIGELIEQHRNEANPGYPVRWDERQMLLGSHFGNTADGLAVYHRSSYDLGDWNFALGLRVDWEHASLDYRSVCNSGYSVYDAQTGQQFQHRDVSIDEHGRLSQSFSQFLPSVTVTRSFGQSMIYATAAKGYKAGGYNNQMFSDVLQQKVQELMGLSMPYKVDDIVSYKPEVSYNYEAGVHVKCDRGRVDASLAAFYIDCRDQQLTVFPPGSVTGRIMTNAGKTHSYGAEVTMRYHPGQFHMSVSYGYTHATFARYDDGKVDYGGKRVPYAPSHTLFASTGYNWKWIGLNWGVDVDLRGVGDIYWDESNQHRQPFYALLGATATVGRGLWSVKLWGENLTETNYKTFRYVSMGRSFYQRGDKMSAGVTLRINLDFK